MYRSCNKRLFGFTYGNPEKFKDKHCRYYNLYQMSDNSDYYLLYAGGKDGGIERICVFGDYIVIDTNSDLRIKEIHDGEDFTPLEYIDIK